MTPSAARKIKTYLPSQKGIIRESMGTLTTLANRRLIKKTESETLLDCFSFKKPQKDRAPLGKTKNQMSDVFLRSAGSLPQRRIPPDRTGYVSCAQSGYRISLNFNPVKVTKL